MSRIVAAASALPGRRLDTATAIELMGSVWPQASRLAARSTESPSTRYVAADLSRVLSPPDLGERMEAYQSAALELSVEAAVKALSLAQVSPEQVDAVVSVSCTGYLVPSLDIALGERLGMRDNLVRLPITELGCSGGAAAIGFAHRHLLALPGHTVLVVAVELPSLTFQPGDRSIDNLTASLVFGDGAGAVLMRGDGGFGMHVRGAASHVVRGTSGSLGFDLRDGGFHVVLDRRLPRIVADSIGDVVAAFMDGQGRGRPQFLAAHTGGPRITDAIQQALGLDPALLLVSREVFDTTGNTSSASILMVVERLMESLGDQPLEGLGIGIGPGVSIELLDLAWEPVGNL